MVGQVTFPTRSGPLTESGESLIRRVGLPRESAMKTSEAMVELTEDDCQYLLAGQRFGRLAFVEGARTSIVLVNYRFDEPNVLIIRTSDGTRLRRGPLTNVAFEIDGADVTGEWGWSVVARGTAFEVSTAADPTHTRLRDLPVNWTAKHRNRWLKVVCHTITGTRFSFPYRIEDAG